MNDCTCSVSEWLSVDQVSSEGWSPTIGHEEVVMAPELTASKGNEARQSRGGH